MRDFRKLEVWKESVLFVKAIYELTNSFPSTEKFGLSSQIQRAAVSVPSNLAEGCSRNSSVEFVRFIEISIGSAFEIETQLEIALELNYINFDNYQKTLSNLHTIQRKLNALRTSIK